MNLSIFSVPIAFFGFLALAVVGQAWIRHRSRIATLRVISEAAIKGAPLDPILVERLLAKPKPAAGKWFGLVNLALGICFLCIGLALSTSQLLHDIGFGVGPIVNLSLGVGLTTLGIVVLRLYSGRWRPAPHWDYPASLALGCLMVGTMGMCIGAALALGSAIGYDDMTTGALVTGFSGVGLTTLGAVILRIFGQVPES